MTSLKILWSFVKKYWSYFALALGMIVGFLLLRNQGAGFADKLKEIQTAHDEELRKINAAREQERKEHEANLKRLEQSLKAVQEQYDAAKKDLDSKKKKEIEELVRLYKDDPETLAKKLSEATGFVIVLPD